MAASLCSLPDEVLNHVAGLLSIRDRFTCSLACSKLHHAAIAATAEIKVVLYDQPQVNSFSAYCQHHGSGCTLLDLHGYRQQPVQLQLYGCKQLQQLLLQSCQLSLSADGSTWGDMLQCTTLTRLDLSLCGIHGDKSTALMQLKALRGLQHLSISYLRVHRLGLTDNRPSYAELPMGLLLQLPYLLHVHIGGGVVVTGSAAHAFAAISKLQVLVLWDAAGISAGAFDGLNQLQHFRCLRLGRPSFSIDQHTVPGVSQLTALQEFELSSCSLHPQVLQGSAKLQDLQLATVKIGPDADASALLAVLPQLQELQSMKLVGLDCLWPAAAPAYTALVASSRLVSLGIFRCSLPVGVWQHVFAPGQHLPQLQELSIWRGKTGDDDDYPGLRLNTADLECAINSCPGLHSLIVMLQPATDHSPFTQLSALRKLTLSGTSAAGVRTIAMLTTLVDIDLYSTADAVVQYGWLLPVTTMRQLTMLECNPFEGDAVDPENDLYGCKEGLCLELEDPAEDPRPVWAKLVEVLASRETIAPFIASSLAQELAEAQQHNRAMQQQLDSQRQQLTQQAAQLEAQQQVAAQQQGRVEELERQLAEQRASSASQAAQIAELQQQVQQLVQSVSRDDRQGV